MKIQAIGCCYISWRFTLTRKHFLQCGEHADGGTFFEFAQAFYEAGFVYGAEMIKNNLPHLSLEVRGMRIG